MRTIEQPQHGKLTAENGTGFSTFPQTNQHFECNKRRSDGVVVLYDPEPGFLGGDSITLEIINPDGTAHKRHYAIDVR